MTLDSVPILILALSLARPGLAAETPNRRQASERHKQAAWDTLSIEERGRVRRIIDSAPDQAAAEEEFTQLGWRLFQLRELQRTSSVMEPWRRDELRDRSCRRNEETLAAMPAQRRAQFTEALGASLAGAGCPLAQAQTAPEPVPAVPEPQPPIDLKPPDPARSPIPGLAPAAYYDALSRAQEAMRRKDWRTAEAAAILAQSLAPAETAASALKGMALSMQGRDKEAVAEIKTALRLKPNAYGLGGALAFTLNRARLFQDAQHSLDAAMANRRATAWSWYQLAYAQAGLGDREGSLRSLEQAVRSKPSEYAPRQRLALAAPDSSALLARFEADPALEAAPFMTRPPGAWARRRLLLRSAWALAFALLLLAVFLVRKRLASWVVRLGTPLPSPLTPIAGMPLSTADGQAFPHVSAGYRIVRQIGSGGMGAVYEAEDLSLQRRVAIKRMRDEIRNDPRERENFLKEARIVAQLRHPSIVEIHAIVEHGGEVFLVFEFLDGKTLDAVVYDNGRLTIPETRSILSQACAALTYAHARGVIHRDLKPGNIMVTRENRVKVMDFGVARQAHDALSRLSVSATVAGTPPYMAPESEAGRVLAESDLYSLAACVYEMLTGSRPFDGTSAGMLFSKMHMSFELPSAKVPSLPPSIDAFFAGALHCDPERRPRTAAAFLAAFAAAAGEPPA